jgi:hypothetical protein
MRTWIINLAAWVAVTLAAAGLARGETVTLAWDASASTNVAGYRVYYGTNSRAYFCVTNAGLVLTQAVVLPHSGRWFFAATAYDTSGLESDFSSEVSWESKPAPPVMVGKAWVRLTPVFGRSTNLAAWGSVTGEASWFPATNRAEYFRVNRLLMERVMVP